ncbi:MAG TPA: YbjN domain-containing protein [Anaerolineae bacterium]|nr:YbjN domain-containing protein [Anaerolineae bacterium]HQI84165.1 YbjN domain-containing protein [Anaerolineae bacterium]
MADAVAPNGHSDTTKPQEGQEHINGWRAFATLTQFLKDDGWYPQQLDEKTIHRVYFAGENGELRCYAQIRVDLEQFLFYVIAPVKAPEQMRAQVAEYIARANYGLRIGNFELDYTDGEVRYKSSIDFEGELLTPRLIKNAMYPAVHTMDFYLPGLLGVMYGNKTPAEAIRDIEE